MKKNIIFLLIAIIALISFLVPEPIGTVIALVTLIPTIIYLIIDLVKNGNRWRKN